MDTPYVRQYTEDREITAWFLIDLSPSMDFGTTQTEKRSRPDRFGRHPGAPADPSRQPGRRDPLQRAGCRPVQRQNNQRVERVIPAQSSRNHVLRLINDLLNQPRLPKAAFTDLKSLLEAGLMTIKKRSLIFVISDFISAPGWERPLSLLNQRHEVLAVRLWDPREVELPDVGPVWMEDAETGEQLYVDTHDPQIPRSVCRGSPPPGGGFERDLPARRGGTVVALDRRRSGAGHRAVLHRSESRCMGGAGSMSRNCRRDLRKDGGETMTFLWPSMLLALLVVPLVVGLYLSMNRKRRSLAAEFGGVQPSSSRAPGFRRHLPAALFLFSLVIILVALARPQAEVSLPRVEGTVILVFDVSASMGATDVEPSRMEAAKTAAREFVLSQPETIKIGIVSFSSSGFTVQTPTNDPNLLLAAIDRLQPTSGTSLGQGILAALHTIAVDAGMVTEVQPTPEDTIQPPKALPRTRSSSCERRIACWSNCPKAPIHPR